MPQVSFQFIAVASLAIILVGLAKGGFIGMGAVGMPVLVLVMEPVSAAAMMLPILIVQDIVGVWSFRHDWDRDLLKWMLPGALIGVFAGWLFSASVDPAAIKGLIGVLALAFGLNRLLEMRGRGIRVPDTLPHWPGLVFGVATGFTSHIAHAGGPPFQVWAFTRGLSRSAFAGSSAILFAAMNWAKVPAYAALGQFTWENMQLSLFFMPVAIAATFIGVALVRHISPQRFFFVVNLLMIGVGTELVRQAWF